MHKGKVLATPIRDRASDTVGLRNMVLKFDKHFNVQIIQTLMTDVSLYPKQVCKTYFVMGKVRLGNLSAGQV